MTRSMNARLQCPTCRCQMTAESAFERWMRESRLLDSRDGVVRFDLDVLLHRYMVKQDGFGRRDIQAMMFVEVKTLGADLTESQRDTLGILDQVLRNRRKNIHSDRNKRNLKDHSPVAKAFSKLRGSEIDLRLFGGHLLRLSGTSPDDSERMTWGGAFGTHEITPDQLTKLLRFELDPDDPRLRLDIRRRSKPLPLIDAEAI